MLAEANAESAESVKIREKFLKEFITEVLGTIQEERSRKNQARAQAEELRRKKDEQKLRVKYIENPHLLTSEELSPSIYGSYSSEKEAPIISMIPEEKPQIKMQQPRMQISPQMQMKSQMPQKFQRPMMQPRSMSLSMPYIPIPGLDFGKLTQLISNPAISSIECQGEGKEIIIKKNEQISKTEIKLSKEEINRIISDFSEKARIPLIEGLLRARVSNLQISAVVSKAASSRFIITKTITAPLARLEQQLSPNQPTKLSVPPRPAESKPLSYGTFPPVKRPFVPLK